MQFSESQTTTEESLKNKVALLFIGASMGGHSLAVSLAQYGADVAIVYQKAHARRALETKEAVEAEGRHCLLVPAQIVNERTFSKEVIRQTIDTLGRLDILIDYSSQPRADLEPSCRTDIIEHEQRTSSDQIAGPFTNVEIMLDAFDQMADLDQPQTDQTDNDSNSVTNVTNRSDIEMRLAQELINKPIFSINEGQELGKVQDIYLDQDLTHLVAIYLGGEGLHSRKETLITGTDVVTLGQDAVLVRSADCVWETDKVEGLETYIRRDDIGDRPVDTPGGTKIGRIRDVILNNEAKIGGFSLSQVYVSGPIAANRAINRVAIVGTGNEDGVMTINLAEAERADLQVVYESIFADPSVSSTKPEEAAAAA